MTDGEMAAEAVDGLFLEGVRDLTHATDDPHLVPSPAAMPALSCPRCCSAYSPSEVRLDGLRMPEDAEDAALVF